MNTLSKSNGWSLAARIFIALCLGVLFVSPFAPTVSASACAAAPARPKLQSPQNGATLATKHVALSWHAVDCATTYSVVVRQDASYGRPLDAAYNLKKPKYNTRRLEMGHWYWWAVEACNANGCVTSRWGKFNLVNE